MRSNRCIIFALLLLFACGPRPRVDRYVERDPANIWKVYDRQYQYISSLAFSGRFTVRSNRAYDCNLQLIYVAPDSFAFLAEGSFGVDIARGALVGDSGFLEIPRENYFSDLYAGDHIYFDDVQVDIGDIIQAVFFFRSDCDFEFVNQTSSRYTFACKSTDSRRAIEINSDSYSLVRQIFLEGDDTVRVDYYGWKWFKIDDPMSGQMQSVGLPARIKILSGSGASEIIYRIKRVKLNPTIDRSHFVPNLQ